MPNVKFSQLPADNVLTDNTIFPVVQSDATTKGQRRTWSVLRAGVVNSLTVQKTVNGADSLTINAGQRVIGVEVLNASGSLRTVAIGNTASGTDIVDTTDIPANAGEDFPIFKGGRTGGSTIHITTSGELTLKFLVI